MEASVSSHSDCWFWFFSIYLTSVEVSDLFLWRWLAGISGERYYSQEWLRDHSGKHVNFTERKTRILKSVQVASLVSGRAWTEPSCLSPVALQNNTSSLHKQGWSLCLSVRLSVIYSSIYLLSTHSSTHLSIRSFLHPYLYFYLFLWRSYSGESMWVSFQDKFKTYFGFWN